MIDVLKSLIKQFMPFAQQQMGFDRPPRLFLKNDSAEADNPMGKTGFYDPQNESITIYIGKRHPKDIMRSLSHELMHHTQNCKGQFNDTPELGEQGYAQNDSHLRTMEIEAYQASIVFRDWEDSCKGTIYYEHLQKGENKMSTKDWKNKELTTLLSEAWGFKFNTLEEFNEFNGNGEVQEEEVEASTETVEEAAEETVEEATETTEETVEESTEETEVNESVDTGVFAPNHYCVHHGGVERNGSVELAEAVGHNFNEDLGKVTHYDMKFEDGTVMENVAFEDIQVTNASLAEGHKHAMKRDEDEEEMDEGAKPDYLDLDKDGNKEEPMKKAAADAKKMTKEDLEALVKKALQEALQNRKG